jgi:AcrR family transcriptional regulator
MSDIMERPARRNGTDRRVQRTRAALISAFNELLLTRGFEAFSASDVAALANVGRSTFYEHFDSKDDLLAQCLVTVLAPLADCCVEPAFAPQLHELLEHFWQNRQMARPLMSGQHYFRLCRQLSGLIADRLAAREVAAGDTSLPHGLAGLQLAHGQLALVQGWLSGRYAASAEMVARRLHASSYASANALSALQSDGHRG